VKKGLTGFSSRETCCSRWSTKGGGFLVRAAEYSGNKNEFTRELERKIASGCRQLAAKNDSLFNE